MKLKGTTELYSIQIMVKSVKTPKIVGNWVGRYEYVGSGSVALRGNLASKWR